MYNIYDIYLSAPIPNDQELLGLKTNKGFLYLNLSFDEVVNYFGNLLVKNILIVGIVGWIIPIEYRDMEKISAEDAYNFAQRAFEEQLHSTEIFNLPILTGEHLLWYIFLVNPKSPEKSARGFSLIVDKLDGHIWGEDDGNKFIIPLENALRRFRDEYESDIKGQNR